MGSAAAVLESIAENGAGGGRGGGALGWDEDEDDEDVGGENHFNSPLPAGAGAEVVLKENAVPAARAGRPQPGRSNFLTTQMTVPETPSPDIASTAKAEVPLSRRAQLAAAAGAGAAGAAGRNVDAASPGKGRVAKSARLVNGGSRNLTNATSSLGSGYVDVCAAAEHLFSAVKESIAAQGPALKATFLEPLQAHLACNLCTELVGKTDEQFMGHFATAGALAALEADRDAVRKRADGLSKMTDEFGELARAL